ALTALIDVDNKERWEMLAAFYHRWQRESLVLDKWFTLQAQSSLPDTLQIVKQLTQDVTFDIKNPNRVRAIIGDFANGNPLRFHAADGEGYEFLTDYILKIDRFNPQLASRLVEPLIHWKKWDVGRQLLMKEQLERILKTPKLSKDVY